VRFSAPGQPRRCDQTAPSLCNGVERQPAAARLVPSAPLAQRCAMFLPALLALCLASMQTPAASAQATTVDSTEDVRSDTALVRELPGFENSYAEVNGTRIHYVAGGAGPALFLLPGWPQTWWEYHKILPRLASKYRVFAGDGRLCKASDWVRQENPRKGYLPSKAHVPDRRSSGRPPARPLIRSMSRVVDPRST